MDDPADATNNATPPEAPVDTASSAAHDALLQELGALLPELRGLADYVRRVEAAISQRVADEVAAVIDKLTAAKS